MNTTLHDEEMNGPFRMAQWCSTSLLHHSSRGGGRYWGTSSQSTDRDRDREREKKRQQVVSTFADPSL